ncbi:phosphatidylinositide phosphatase SAC2 isoform X1 [Tribolium castaneum]|uniref:phosphatidylinositide phosphatase SAC2 isoform X1 n=1 Tax=Tribolium castaneum TaxID=7070 RepID=UPI00046C3148|nr:PREDICTED: phosphatidylinositide phosphatase SAC2 isoform X1 [Tribolium castaneum]|eukprot:XP_008198080.1 PREDICTED: phosphatidylinositide phosphatase SAC2 isoform X1 [Tribolium castaneum]
MELFRTNEFYIFVSGEYSLWWDRQTGAFIPKTGWDLADADDPICLGLCDGIVGKVEHSSVFDQRLLLIKESLPVGKLHGDNDVYKIKSVVFLPLGPENVDLNLQTCPKHKSYSAKKNTNSLFDIQKNAALTKTWGTLKSAGNTIKTTTQQAAAIATGTPKRRDFKDKERFERQIIEEFYKIFTDTNSFYFSRTTDLTNSLQRWCCLEKQDAIDPKALWKTVEDRFFWNRHMLKDLIELNNPLCDPWILPIIQGYIQIENCRVDLPKEFQSSTGKNYEIFTLCILSRRSRFRAGTRYKRRGVDEDGQCANYVETEQLVAYQNHEVSFVQVRGSVPVYWSQPGYKYRPPPRIDKGEAETKVAFEKHFSHEVQKYGPVCAINLIDQTGKERVIFDAYSNYVLLYNSPFITYVTFDFHEYCRGMHFENVSILINALADVIKDMNYCWRDKQGHICSQNGVFRVNCIDCLDRTNVVQTAIGKAVMEMQFCKLGLITPEGVMPNNIKNTFQLLWANNGDTISKQYAGTNALKGDYTRTGERKFTGIMKDGMNSANRYYKNHFKDSVRQCCLDIMHGVDLNEIEVQDFWTDLKTVGCIASEILPDEPPSYTPQIALQQEFEFANLLFEMSRYYLSRFKDSTRQGTIDLMLGNVVSEDNFTESKTQQFEEDSAATAEHVKLLIEDCKKMLINQPELVLGSWGLINADPATGDPNETEMDSILILTKDSYFVADYDDQVDKVTKYQRVLLQDISLLECGIPEAGASLFRAAKNRFCIRINYKVDGVSGYYHMFRSTNLRFFNNMAVMVKNEEEEIESLKAICEAFVVALDICGLPPVPFNCGKCLDRRKSKVINNEGRSIYLDIVGLPQITRNVSESQLLSLKNVGTKAISNMTQQFSKLNKIGSTFKKSKLKKANFTIGTNKESSSDTDDDYENSIFQPNASTESGSLHFATDSSSSTSHVEEGVEATEDTFLPSVGIVMGNTGDAVELTLEQKQNLLTREDSSQVDNVQLSSIMQISLQNPAPEIQINSEGFDKKQPPNTLKLDKKFSHSSGEVDESDSKPAERFDKRSNSDYDVALNISQSQSESALKNRLSNVASPVASAKDLFSPLSKFAKGVQNLGANLDPRKLGQVRVSEREMEEHRKLQEKWQNSKTRLIAL